MWVFCKNECVKQKKQVLEVQNGKFFAPTDVIALTHVLTFGESKVQLFTKLFNTGKEKDT